MYIYELTDVVYKQNGFELAIKDCSLQRGGIYAVTGPNGSGKTSLLNILSLMAAPKQGTVGFYGEKIPYGDTDVLLKNRRKIGYLLQNPYLFNISVEANISYGLKLRRYTQSGIQQRTSKVMERLGLNRLAHRNAHQLSGGEAQRTALARTLVLEADVYLLDEPTANVDKENIRAVEEVILSLNRDQQATVVVTTHSPEQAYRLSQNIIPVIDGKITDITYENVFSGTVKEEGDGTRSLALSRKVRIVLSKGESGPVSIAIDPQDIILSNGKLSSSALNNFQGTINRLEQVNGSLRVYIDVGVTFCALITQRSYNGMGLNIGKKVWLTFKANSIKLL